jgi:hypothetical protein
MKYAIAVIAIIAVLAVIGCGGSGSTSINTPASPTATVAPADINQQIADRYAAADPKDTAALCRYATIYPGMSRKIMRNQLGNQIITQGGDISVVVEDLLAKC